MSVAVICITSLNLLPCMTMCIVCHGTLNKRFILIKFYSNFTEETLIDLVVLLIVRFSDLKKERLIKNIIMRF